MATTSQLKAKFGNPTGDNGHVDPTWYRDNIIKVELPYRMKLAWDLDTYVYTVLFNKHTAPALVKALTNAYNEARIQVKKKFGSKHDSMYYDEKTRQFLAERRLDLFGGTFNYRTVRGNPNVLSTHAFGIAIDIDPAHNMQGNAGKIPEWFGECFEDVGFTWGKRWTSKSSTGKLLTDSMHFEKSDL